MQRGTADRKKSAPGLPIGGRPGADDRFMRQQPCIGSGPMIPGEVVRMVCSNEACPYNQYVPLTTFQQFEEYVLMALKKAPRARGWTPEQCRMNLWTKKGYELVYRACGCNCGKGFVRRDMQFLEPMVLLGDGTPPQPKAKPVVQPVAAAPPAAPVSAAQRKMPSDMALPQPKAVPAPAAAPAGGVSLPYPVAAPLAIDEDSDEEGICPLCMEEMDTTDQTFLPCSCGYQMCLYCFNHVKENLNGQCPACRTPYDTNNYRFKEEPKKRTKEKKDPAVKEAEMMAQAQAVARQQAQLRADMIARAQQAQAAAAAAGGSAAQHQHAMRALAARDQDQGQDAPSGGGSWAAMASQSDSAAPAMPPQNSSQAWPSLGGSAAPTQAAGGSEWGTNASGEGGVDDWESLASGEDGTVPSLDDAKKDAEVAALLRQVAELQRKLQEAQGTLAAERTIRESATEKCVAIRTQQVQFDQELMAMATKWQLESQAESDRSGGSLGLPADPSIISGGSSWNTSPGLPPAGTPAMPDFWSNPSAFPGGVSDFNGSNFAGLTQAPGQPAQSSRLPAANGQLPGLSSIFGGGLSGSADSVGVWGGSSAQATTGASPWTVAGGADDGSAMGGSAGGSSIW